MKLPQYIHATLPFVLGIVLAQPLAAQSSGVTYDEVLAKAQALLNEGKLGEAYLAASAAVSIDPKRWEAHAAIALALVGQGNPKEAASYLDKAKALAPPEKQETIDRIKERIARAPATPAAPTASPAPPPSTAPAMSPAGPSPVGPAFSPEEQRKRDALLLILADADKAAEQKQRVAFLREYLKASFDYSNAHEDDVPVWVARAMAAVELDYPGAGFLAGMRLKRLTPPLSEEPKVKQVMVHLERKGWLGKERAWRDWSKSSTDDVLRLAGEGDTEAQFAIGAWYLEGTSGLPKDPAKAYLWTRKAAESGEVEAMDDLGKMLAAGRGVAKDEAEATIWTRKAAEGGNVRAMIVFGMLLEGGLGVAKDNAEAVRWFRKAVERGNLFAMLALGGALANGRGVAKDEVEAVRWYRNAAEGGNGNAMFLLGFMFLDGRGVAKDEAEAVRWMEKAAAAGFEPAKQWLADRKAK